MTAAQTIEAWHMQAERSSVAADGNAYAKKQTWAKPAAGWSPNRVDGHPFTSSYRVGRVASCGRGVGCTVNVRVRLRV